MNSSTLNAASKVKTSKVGKAKKTVKKEKSLIELIDIHTLDDESLPSVREYLQFGSIDPAEKNLACRIERRYRDPTKDTGIFVDTGHHTVNNISPKGIYKSQWTVLNAYLDSIRHMLVECDYIIIEKQVKMNRKANFVQQHIIAFLSLFLINNERKTKIFLVDSKLKNLFLNPNKGDNLKALATAKCILLFLKREDQAGLNLLNANVKKNDDLADVVCQLEAFIMYLELDRFLKESYF